MPKPAPASALVVKRNPDQTRQRLLDAAFCEIYRNGFRAASVDQILSETGLTKGALYHHFPNKSALGYAVVDEVIFANMNEKWIRPMSETDDPIGAVMAKLHGFSPAEVEQVCSQGCPLNNLAQEMSPVDEEFRRRIERVFSAWREALAGAFERGVRAGKVRSDADCQEAAGFVVASIEGAVGLAKNSQEPGLLDCCMRGLMRYLEALRA